MSNQEWKNIIKSVRNLYGKVERVSAGRTESGYSVSFSARYITGDTSGQINVVLDNNFDVIR